VVYGAPAMTNEQKTKLETSILRTIDNTLAGVEGVAPGSGSNDHLACAAGTTECLMRALSVLSGIRTRKA